MRALPCVVCNLGLLAHWLAWLVVSSASAPVLRVGIYQSTSEGEEPGNESGCQCSGIAGSKINPAAGMNLVVSKALDPIIFCLANFWSSQPRRGGKDAIPGLLFVQCLYVPFCRLISYILGRGSRRVAQSPVHQLAQMYLYRPALPNKGSMLYSSTRHGQGRYIRTHTDICSLPRYLHTYLPAAMPTVPTQTKPPETAISRVATAVDAFLAPSSPTLRPLSLLAGGIPHHVQQ